MYSTLLFVYEVGKQLNHSIGLSKLKKGETNMFNEILIIFVAGILTEVAKILILELVEYIKRKLNS